MELTKVRYGDRDGYAIEQFVAIDRVFTTAGLVGLIAAKLWLFESQSLWIVVLFLVFHLACLSLAGRFVTEGRSAAVVLLLIVVGNWSVALAVSAIVPYLFPVMALTVLMPVVLATPFLERAQLLSIVVLAAFVAGVSSAIGMLRAGYGVAAEVSNNLQIVTVVSVLVIQIVPIGLIVWQNNRLQHESLVRATELNVLLRHSQEELAASRRRVLLAGDVERRRIERNLHDGAQQRLLAVAVRLRMLETDTDDLPELNGPIEELIGEIDAAIEDVRDLAHGIYPPLLESLGLAEALSVVAQRSSIPVRSVLSGIGRLDPSVETALYFTALEAMTNAAKHAPAATVDLRLVDDGPTITLSVTDDGPGFVIGAGEPSATENFRDRVAAIGGMFNIASEVGHGTTVTAVVPKVIT